MNIRHASGAGSSGRLARQRGFTLLELIVAASILALIAVFSWRGLDALLRERDAIATSQDGIDAMQRAFARIERDAMLARDAELDEDGTLRLLASPGASDAASESVEYRFVDGALTRRVGGAAPVAIQSGLAKLAIEAWVPGRPGAWQRARKIPAPIRPPTVAGAQAATPGAQGTAAGAPAANLPGASAPPAQAVPGANAAGTIPAGGAAPPTPQPDVATGIRLSFARADGERVERTFLIGSGG